MYLPITCTCPQASPHGRVAPKFSPDQSCTYPSPVPAHKIHLMAVAAKFPPDQSFTYTHPPQGSAHGTEAAKFPPDQSFTYLHPPQGPPHGNIVTVVAAIFALINHSHTSHPPPPTEESRVGNKQVSSISHCSSVL
jgi:hypothetical protein